MKLNIFVCNTIFSLLVMIPSLIGTSIAPHEMSVFVSKVKKSNQAGFCPFILNTYDKKSNFLPIIVPPTNSRTNCPLRLDSNSLVVSPIEFKDILVLTRAPLTL